MRILYLADSGSPHTQKWVRHFVQRGDEVHIASLVDTSVEGATLHSLQRPTKTKLDYLASVGFVRRLIKELNPDILHAHYTTGYGLLGALSGFHPLVISAWGMDILGFPETTTLHRKTLIWILAQADTVCATSHQLAKATKYYLSDGKNPIVTPFGVDSQVFCPTIEKKRQGLTIGIVKSLAPKYGVEYLLRAFAQVQKKISTGRLLIVGEGYLRKGLQKLAVELQVSEKTQFAGYIPNIKVPEWLGQIDVFVNPSIHESETFGVAVLEAQACEIPVIASNIGGLPEVVQDGVTGFLVPPQNVDAIAEKIELLAANEELRRRIGKAGREFVKKYYDWNENAKIMERLYDSLVKK